MIALSALGIPCYHINRDQALGIVRTARSGQAAMRTDGAREEASSHVLTMPGCHELPIACGRLNRARHPVVGHRSERAPLRRSCVTEQNWVCERRNPQMGRSDKAWALLAALIIAGVTLAAEGPTSVSWVP